MFTGLLPHACPVCCYALATVQDHDGVVASCQCKRCGGFQLTYLAHEELKYLRENDPAGFCGEQLSSLLCEIELRRSKARSPKLRLVNGSESIESPSSALQLVRIGDLLSNFPKTLAERRDRALLNLRAVHSVPGESFTLETPMSNSLFFAETDAAFLLMQEMLMDEELIKYGEFFDPVGKFAIHWKGWQRISELESIGAGRGNLAFVAMAFTDLVDPVFREAILPACEGYGYVAERVDTRPTPGEIPPRIFAMIRESRFVIADFTHQRKGVYLEAGFAEGLGKPVLYTCHKDYFDEKSADEERRPHFDIRNRHHLLWTTSEVLRLGLQDLIGAHIGRPIVA